MKNLKELQKECRNLTEKTYKEEIQALNKALGGVINTYVIDCHEEEMPDKYIQNYEVAISKNIQEEIKEKKGISIMFFISFRLEKVYYDIDGVKEKPKLNENFS